MPRSGRRRTGPRSDRTPSERWPDERVATQPPSVEYSQDCGSWPSSRPRVLSVGLEGGTGDPGTERRETARLVEGGQPRHPLEVDREDRRIAAGGRAELGRRQPADDVRAAAVGHDRGAGRPGKIGTGRGSRPVTTAARRRRGGRRAGRCGGRSSRRGSGHGRAGRGPPGRPTGVGGRQPTRRDRRDDVGEERVRRRPTLADDALEGPEAGRGIVVAIRVVAPAVPASGHAAMVTHRVEAGASAGRRPTPRMRPTRR